MMLAKWEIKKILARIAQCDRRIAKGYVVKGPESEQQRKARLGALILSDAAEAGVGR